MTKAISLLVARETQAWVEALYDSGVLTVDAKGGITINPKVRGLISQMHDLLAAGDANQKASLEKSFDDAVAATSALSANMGVGTLSI
jgi:hypothetical protein